MALGILVLLILLGTVAQLKYLCLEQNNSYKLACGRVFALYYIITVMPVIMCYIFVTIAYYYGQIFLYFAIISVIIDLIYIFIKTVTQRVRFKFTPRGQKYFIFYEVLYFLFITLLLIYIKNKYIAIMSLCSVILGIPIIIKIVEYPINLIYSAKNRKFILLQKRRLKEVNPIVIGITGSYGKTSCKKILEYLLKDEYVFACTEKNFNTPIGIALSIEKLNGNEEVFIVEFGARHVGDIEELCELFTPNYGIITGVCEQHLESFGTLENIFFEKFKLAEAVRNNGGVCCFNVNDKNAFRMWRDFRGRKISAGVCKKADVYATDIDVSEKGSTFKLCVGDKIINCKTKLLGKHNIQNIVLCVSLALELGCNLERIIEKIEKLAQISHRLEYIYANGIHILDDGYNGNVYGVKSSFDILQKFPGRHIVVSQGIVELGSMGSEINENIGKDLARCADAVILCGPNARKIKKGLVLSHYKGDIFCAKNCKSINKLIKQNVLAGDTLLLQNDVPDIY